jgi:PST family polysaccharide transporter/lipopolysaccharide exporter
VIFALINFIVWTVFFQRIFHFKLILSKNTPKMMIRSLNDYGFWHHLNNTVIDTLIIIDVVILSFLGFQKEIASYTIAIKFVSMFSIISLQLSKSLQVLISNQKNIEKQVKAINSFIKINALVSICQLITVLLVGNIILRILFGSNIEPEVFHYTIILLVGATALNICYPYLSILNNKSNLKQLFFSTFLPILITGLLLYFLIAKHFGVEGIAFSRLFILFIVLVLIIFQTFKNFKFKSNFSLLTNDEKEFIKSYFKKQKSVKSA